MVKIKFYVINIVAFGQKAKPTSNQSQREIPPKKPEGDTESIREKVLLSKGEKWRILKNISIISFAFMIQFTAFQV
uniref:Uncharacterized protein n=1 Tax=Megaselia scalaris TaxID=36166 RepID=T1GXK0_MEGSC